MTAADLNNILMYIYVCVYIFQQSEKSMKVLQIIYTTHTNLKQAHSTVTILKHTFIVYIK